MAAVLAPKTAHQVADEYIELVRRMRLPGGVTEYERLKRRFVATFPDATPEQYTAAMRAFVMATRI